MTTFSPIAIERLRAYVYILQDPRDGKIFYVGKGNGNRVFQHAECALETSEESDKLNIIRDIIASGNKVKYYIVRHGLDNDDAFTVESVLIDLLTYPSFPDLAKISNIVTGHHEFDLGIKTVEEIGVLYDCPQLEPTDFEHRVLAININNTYNKLSERHPNIYEATRKAWHVNVERARKVEYVLSEYKGVVRAIFKPNKWYLTSPHRWAFEGVEITKENNPVVYNLYMHKKLPPKLKGVAVPTRYFGE